MTEAKTFFANLAAHASHVMSEEAEMVGDHNFNYFPHSFQHTFANNPY